MRRAAVLVFVLLGGGCYQRANDRLVPAAFVNDACGGHATEASCGGVAGCEWHAVATECPPGVLCPVGLCVTHDPCAQLPDQPRCETDTRCAWSGVRLESASIDLCPVGQGCDAGGYCHARDASGGGCTCVRPIACPENADCPAVECDCSKPPPGAGASGSGGGGTCTCTCPICAPGEACPPCTCDCGGGGGGSCAGGGTCTCACPACAPGASCPPCDCACGAGNVGVSGSDNTSTGTTTAGAAIPDPCAPYGDAQSCLAAGANSCSWIELGIVCIAAPCPSGACVQVKAVPGGGGGCGCACPACVAGQSCPPCACDCCGPMRGAATLPVPVPA